MIKQDIQNKGYKYVWQETLNLNNTGFQQNLLEGLFLSILFLQMTNKVGKEIFQRAGELNVPVGFMCMKVFLLPFLLLHI